MKAFILGPAYPLRGGIADTNESFARALNRHGCTTTILSYRYQYPGMLFPGKTQFAEGPPPDNLPKVKPILHSLRPDNWLRTGRYIKRQNPDFIISRFWMPFFSPALGSIHRILGTGCPRLALTDNLIPHEHRPGDDALIKYFVKSCDAFVAMSKTVQEEVRQYSNRPGLYLPHPVNEGLGEKMNREEARRTLNLRQDGVQLLFFGLVRAYKGLDLLLEALSLAPVRDLNWHLVVAGEFYENAEVYHQQVARLGLEDRVRFDEGFVPRDKIPLYFSAADLVAQPYRTATQSGITQMAYHFDCPMLVTNVGGLPDMVPDREAGYVVPPQPEAIAKAIDHFISRRKYEAYSRNVSQLKKQFTWDAFVGHLLKFVNDLRSTPY